MSDPRQQPPPLPPGQHHHHQQPPPPYHQQPPPHHQQPPPPPPHYQQHHQQHPPPPPRYQQYDQQPPPPSHHYQQHNQQPPPPYHQYHQHVQPPPLPPTAAFGAMNLESQQDRLFTTEVQEKLEELIDVVCDEESTLIHGPNDLCNVFQHLIDSLPARTTTAGDSDGSIKKELDEIEGLVDFPRRRREKPRDVLNRLADINKCCSYNVLEAAKHIKTLESLIGLDGNSDEIYDLNDVNKRLARVNKHLGATTTTASTARRPTAGVSAGLNSTVPSTMQHPPTGRSSGQDLADNTTLTSMSTAMTTTAVAAAAVSTAMTTTAVAAAAGGGGTTSGSTMTTATTAGGSTSKSSAGSSGKPSSKRGPKEKTKQDIINTPYGTFGMYCPHCDRAASFTIEALHDKGLTVESIPFEDNNNKKMVNLQCGPYPSKLKLVPTHKKLCRCAKGHADNEKKARAPLYDTGNTIEGFLDKDYNRISDYVKANPHLVATYLRDEKEFKSHFDVILLEEEASIRGYNSQDEAVEHILNKPYLMQTELVKKDDIAEHFQQAAGRYAMDHRYLAGTAFRSMELFKPHFDIIMQDEVDRIRTNPEQAVEYILNKPYLMDTELKEMEDFKVHIKKAKEAKALASAQATHATAVETDTQDNTEDAVASGNTEAV